NATGVETGQPILFGTTCLSPKLPLFEGANDSRLEQQFLLTFSAADMPVSTAARMSAAFPYVSPEARPDSLPVKSGQNPYCGTIDASPLSTEDGARLHIADGGLFDNSGVVSAVHWIYDLSQDKSIEHHRPVILIMITSPYLQKSGKKWSWQR